jgi:hypothetical protein
MSRENARPQPHRPPAATGTEERQRRQPRCWSGSPATELSGPQVAPPGAHPAQTPAPPVVPCTQGVPVPGGRWGKISAPGLLDRAARSWSYRYKKLRLRAPSSPNLTDLRPPNRTPGTGNPPSRCLYQTPAAVGGVGRAPLTPRRAPGAPKCARRPCNGTQEIAKSFWSYFYGGLS